MHSEPKRTVSVASSKSAVERMAWSVTEAAERLGVGRTTAFELIATGQLRSFRILGRRLVSDDALRALIAEREFVHVES